MMYAFHEYQLYKKDKYILPQDVPTNTYIYQDFTKEWYVRFERMYFRPVKPKHIPKKLKALCLILSIPI
jgi:hypothetical protein